MKKLARFAKTRRAFILIATLLSFGACSEDFNPVQGLLQPEYVLTSVIRGDTSFQVATLYKAYEDQETERLSPVHGADIRVWFADTVFFFKEDSMYRNGSMQTVYTCDDERFRDLNEIMEIEAVVPYVVKLRGKTSKPQPVELNFGEGEAAIPNTRGFSRFVWRSPDAFVYFQPRLTLKYFHQSAEDTTWYEIVIPVTVNDDGSLDTVANRTLEPIYLMPNRSVDYVMNKISEGDPIKENYHIYAAFLEIITLDQNLARYYGSTAREIDSYTIKTDETDFSNIENGFGIFGSLRKDRFQVKVIRTYIESFGYKAEIPD